MNYTGLNEPSCRIALLSSPRSGNTWVRNVLSFALNLKQFAVHNYLDIDQQMPSRSIVQTHWYREPNFQNWLKEGCFQKVTISRNPLDVFVSVLHFSRYNPDVKRWLEGNTAIPEGFEKNSPTSREFFDYCMSYGAENLLSVTYQWWKDDSVFRLRYEDCVANPSLVLGQMVKAFGGDSVDIESHLERTNFTQMRKLINRHAWQATPGLYKKLIPPASALKIYLRHRRVFETLDYRFSPYLLSTKAAIMNWEMLRDGS